MEEFKRALCDAMHGTLCAARERGADLDLTRTLVFNCIRDWFDDHPGLEDNTVKCSTCSGSTTKANRIEPLCRADAPTYLCERCCEVRRRVIANAIG